jgi:hypothetical protein
MDCCKFKRKYGLLQLKSQPMPMRQNLNLFFSSLDKGKRSIHIFVHQMTKLGTRICPVKQYKREKASAHPQNSCGKLQGQSRQIPSKLNNPGSTSSYETWHTLTIPYWRFRLPYYAVQMAVDFTPVTPEP